MGSKKNSLSRFPLWNPCYEHPCFIT